MRDTMDMLVGKGDGNGRKESVHGIRRARHLMAYYNIL